MYWLAFGFSQLLCAIGAAWFFESWHAALLGALAGAWIWWLIYAWQGHMFFLWAKQASVRPPMFIGIWSHLEYFWRRQQRKNQRNMLTLQREFDGLQQAIHASPNGVVLLDEAWRIVWLNQVASEHFGLSAEHDIGKVLTNLVRSPDFSNFCAVGDFSHALEMEGRSKDALSAMGVPISVYINEYGDGQKLMISRDITVMQKNDAMRRDFVANVSHEIRTPLTILAGFVETLQTISVAPHEQARYLGLMQQQAERMQLLVQDLLTLSRLEASPLPSLSEQVSLHAMLSRCRDEAIGLSVALAPDTNEPVHRIEVVDVQPNGQALELPLAGPALADLMAQTGLDASAVLGRMSASEHEVSSAVTNLIANAVRYTPAGGGIRIAWVWQADGSALFSVQDSGPGIAAEHLPRLTERFYRVDRSRSRETGGTGLGLAIVKHVSQRHGGVLLIESELGKGSTFTITIPASRLQTPQAIAQDLQKKAERERLLARSL